MSRLFVYTFAAAIAVQSTAEAQTPKVPFTDFLAVEVYPGSRPGSFDNDIVLKNISEEKSSDIISVNKAGLVIHGKTVCTWAYDKVEQKYGPLGYEYDKNTSWQKSKKQPCPAESPIQAASDYNYWSSETEPLNEILIHVVKIDEDKRIIEVPFRGALYRGIIPAEYSIKLQAGKGTAVGKTAAARAEKLRKQRATDLQKLGVGQVRAAILKCIHDKRGATCLEGLLPAGKELFEHDAAGGLLEECKAKRNNNSASLTAGEVYDCLGKDESFRLGFLSCLTGSGSSFEIQTKRKKRTLQLVPDGAAEMHWTCKFVEENGGWKFQKMEWQGC